MWRRALTLRLIMNNNNSWTLKNLIDISNAKFFISIYPFQIRSSSVLSLIHLVEVSSHSLNIRFIRLTSVGEFICQTSNGCIMDTLRIQICNSLNICIHGSPVPLKSTKIGIQRIIMNPQYLSLWLNTRCLPIFCR